MRCLIPRNFSLLVDRRNRYDERKVFLLPDFLFEPIPYVSVLVRIANDGNRMGSIVLLHRVPSPIFETIERLGKIAPLEQATDLFGLKADHAAAQEAEMRVVSFLHAAEIEPTEEICFLACLSG